MDRVLKDYVLEQANKYRTVARLTTVFDKYENNTENEKFLAVEVMNSNGVLLPLPSGEEGNQLGLALQLGCLKSARYMIKNSEYLGLDLTKTIEIPFVKGADEVYRFYKDIDDSIYKEQKIKQRKRPINE